MRKAYDLARADLGTWEWKDGHNPKVVQYFADVGHSWVKDDETAWCAAFVGAMLKRSGLPHTGKLTARSYLDWGDPVSEEDVREGDIVVFSRGNPNGWQGHVGFVVEVGSSNVLVLGGNQGNKVSERHYNKARLLGYRRMEAEGMPDLDAINETLTTPKKRAPTKSAQSPWAAFFAALGRFLKGGK